MSGHSPTPRGDAHDHPRHAMPAVPSLGSQLWSLLALMALLGLTAAGALIPMGVFNTIASLAIAAAKALVVLVFYMRLQSDRPLIRIVAAIGFAWLALLIGLSLADQLTRNWPPLPN